jgi:hypothetical protein
VTAVPDLHPGIAALAPLLGDWSGAGTGDYPTIAPFGYTEEVTFGHTGKPFLTYTQRTRSNDGLPLHAETGYLRMPSPHRVELTLAHPTGITEIDEGSVAFTDRGLVLDVYSTAVAGSASAKEVVAVARSICLDGDELSYTLQMAAVGLPRQHHLSATLYRQS